MAMQWTKGRRSFMETGYRALLMAGGMIVIAPRAFAAASEFYEPFKAATCLCNLRDLPFVSGGSA